MWYSYIIKYNFKKNIQLIYYAKLKFLAKNSKIKYYKNHG